MFAVWSLSVQASKSQNLGDDCRRTQRKSVKRKEKERKCIERQQETCMIMSVTNTLHNIMNCKSNNRLRMWPGTLQFLAALVTFGVHGQGSRQSPTIYYALLYVCYLYVTYWAWLLHQYCYTVLLPWALSSWLQGPPDGALPAIAASIIRFLLADWYMFLADF